MKNDAVHLRGTHSRSLLATVALLVSAAILLAGLAGTASAKRHSLVANDGKIHACYRVKGKPKGALRVVRSPRAHCHRGERKVAWSVAATAPGSSGQQGSAGQPGTSGTSSDEAELKAQIGALTFKVDALEGLLAGITGGDLSGLLGRVNGLEGVLDGVDNEGLTHAVDTVKDLTGDELLEAVDAVPLVETVCEQTEALTGRSNALLGFLDTLDALNVLSIPSVLPTFNVCPAP